jgi:hypothetical protein
MSNDELSKWFWNKFNSCYVVVHESLPESIYMIYDKNFIRQQKLSRVTSSQYPLNYNKSGICLFHLDFKNRWFDCDSDEIWAFFEKNYSPHYYEIQSFITRLLTEQAKLSTLTIDKFSGTLLPHVVRLGTLTVQSDRYALSEEDNDKLHIIYDKNFIRQMKLSRVLGI